MPSSWATCVQINHTDNRIIKLTTCGWVKYWQIGFYLPSSPRFLPARILHYDYSTIFKWSCNVYWTVSTLLPLSTSSPHFTGVTVSWVTIGSFFANFRWNQCMSVCFVICTLKHTCNSNFVCMYVHVYCW